MKAKFFGQFLLERGRISHGQLLETVELWNALNVKLGMLAVSRGYMQAEQILLVKRRQREEDKKFGEIAVEEGFLTQAQVDELLALQTQGRRLFGETLVRQGYLTRRSLDRELEVFQRTQEEIPDSLREVYRGRPHARILEVFADMTRKVFLRIIDERIKMGPCHADPSQVSTYDFTIRQRYVGGFNGVLSLHLGSDLLSRIQTKLREEADRSGSDGAAEFLAIISRSIGIKLQAMGKRSDADPPVLHDNRDVPALDLIAEQAGGMVTVTPIFLPDCRAELSVLDCSQAEGQYAEMRRPTRTLVLGDLGARDEPRVIGPLAGLGRRDDAAATAETQGGS